jgi:glycosyltransferase involved in cell wall biosynthesis
MDRPRVALVAHKVHDEGGMERALAELIRHAHEEVRFEVVALQLQDELRELVTWHRVPGPLRPVPMLFAGFYFRAGAVLRRLRADLVHVTGALVPNRADLATVHFCHAAFRRTGVHAPRASPPRRLNSAVDGAMSLAAERRAYRPDRVRLLAAVSAGVERELAGFYPGVPRTIVPNGVDTRRFRPDAVARAEVREALGADERSVVAVFVGGDWERKGLAVAIEALALARARRDTDLRLWVVGRGGRRWAEDLAHRAGVADRIRFVGPQSAPERFFAGADVHVLPTRYETFGLVALEAAASGLPVLATRGISGVEDVVRDGREGLLVKRTGESFAEALARLAEDSASRRRMGEAARERALSFGWDRSAQATLAAYGRLLRRAV